MTAESFLVEKGRKTERALEGYLGSWGETPSPLKEAIRYSLMAGGKRLRPALVLGTADLIAGDDAVALPAACAIEMIHTYSLIHDDLPSMDNDDLRRGKPTLHKVYGEAIAILAGDGLMAMAFDILAQTGDIRVVGEIARAAGVNGMVGGQVLDLRSEGRKLPLSALEDMHRRKTGALIRASVRAGALLTAANDDQLAALTKYGEHIGLAFQIADDILDVTGDTMTLGKTARSDEAHHKLTYPSVVGLDESQKLARAAADAAIGALNIFRSEADTLRGLADYIVEREK